ncbi:hypothetical protein [Paractinoplanes hotanensis]|uniref:Uncharacterized protein n=1 Tax=Paractinoplanes hotanensis TaxID=2906497 RepID=A0ABT0XQP4_9ACTN|nr:hypothetical protein [Actinoplanes hotanensis]MCM4075990.1 hypothetical protein [Actinoplanes hotanensis]
MVLIARGTAATVTSGDAARSRLFEAMAAMGAVVARPLRGLDRHRMLDVMVLVTREA